MARHKDSEWNIVDKGTATAEGSRAYNHSTIYIALLMDIRDELKQLNLRILSLNEKQTNANQKLTILSCPNFVAIPELLRVIRRNTANLPKVPRKGK